MEITTIKQLIGARLSNDLTAKEIKNYRHFSDLLVELEAKNLESPDVDKIGVVLSAFVASDGSLVSFKLFKKQVAKFTYFLQTEFKFTAPNYYMQIGIGVGLCFGVTFGTMFNMGLGLSIGMALGLVVGKYLDNLALKEGRVIGKAS